MCIYTCPLLGSLTVSLLYGCVINRYICIKYSCIVHVTILRHQYLEVCIYWKNQVGLVIAHPYLISGHPDLTVTGVGMAPDSTGQRGQTQSLTIPDKEVLARHRHSDGSVFTSPQPVRSYTLSGSVTPSGGSKAGGNYRSRPADFYSPRRNTTNSYNNTRAGLGECSVGTLHIYHCGQGLF